ncbi:MAG: Tex-like N-terminal domain-containing protein, partial [Synergistota bacterium]|nr:Tex-like N-terminal domain-containing protein [Synergistota bacterium]
MKSTHAAAIAAELGIKPAQVGSVADLIAEGSTVPFIARYRKESTGSLDETVIRAVRDRITQLEELDKRREAILKSLEERDLLTDELKKAVEDAKTMTGLEDIYLPYRPKRRTRATIAREKGLDPLAGALMEAAAGKGEPMEPLVAAEAFIDEEKGVATAEEALAGARDIIAEDVSENAPARSALRFLFVKRGKMQSRVAKGKETEGATYRDYFDWAESARNAPSHRVLAMFRGEKEGMLTLSVTPPTEEAVEMLCKRFISVPCPAAGHVRMAIEDGYKRLAGPSMETEIRNALKSRADKKAVGICADNLETLLLAPPRGR